MSLPSRSAFIITIQFSALIPSKVLWIHRLQGNRHQRRPQRETPYHRPEHKDKGIKGKQACKGNTHCHLQGICTLSQIVRQYRIRYGKEGIPYRFESGGCFQSQCAQDEWTSRQGTTCQKGAHVSQEQSCCARCYKGAVDFHFHIIDEMTCDTCIKIVMARVEYVKVRRLEL